MTVMRRSLLLVIPLIVAVAALALLAGVGRPSPARGDVAAPSSVTTTGHGVVTAVPDRATVTAGVHTQAATASDALAENAKLANAVVAALKTAGGTRLQTQQVSLYPQTGRDGRITGYAADDSVSASTPVDGAGGLIDAAVAAGANTVSGPTLDVSSQTALYRQALVKAVDDARAKADTLAAAGGFALGSITSVSESSQSIQPPVFEAAGAAQRAALTPVEPGEQDTTADVTVTFGIH
jgi:uncharacterized protein YggE